MQEAETGNSYLASKIRFRQVPFTTPGTVGSSAVWQLHRPSAAGLGSISALLLSWDVIWGQAAQLPTLLASISEVEVTP